MNIIGVTYAIAAAVTWGLVYAIDQKILTKVASLMVSRGVLSGGTVTVDISSKGEFTFDVKKSARATKAHRAKAYPKEAASSKVG